MIEELHASIDITPGEEIFLDLSPRYAAQPEASLEHGVSRKLLPSSMVPYPVIQANQEFVMIRVDGLPMTVSIDHCTRASPLPGVWATIPAERIEVPDTDPDDMILYRLALC